MTTRILVCGGRDYGNTKEEFFEICEKLNDLCLDKGWILQPDEYGNWMPNVFVISGKADGVDAVANNWAIVNWCGYMEFPADWDKYGKAAGPIRNKQMLDEGMPHFVVAFKGGKGTANMIKQAKEAGIPVIKIDD